MRPVARAVRAASSDAPPLTVDRALLQFLPYEHAAPRLAVPVGLTGDVLTVAVALPSVDLSIITERCPWLTVQREVTDYHRIVQALREVAAVEGVRARRVLGRAGGRDAVEPVAGAPADAPDAHALDAGPDIPAEIAARIAPTRSERARSDARASGAKLAAALGRVTRARPGQAAAGAITGIAVAAALLTVAGAPPGVEDAPAHVALNTALCIVSLAAAWLAVACHGMRRSPASLALAVGLGAFTCTTAIALAGSPMPATLAGPQWAALPSGLLFALALLACAGLSSASSRRAPGSALVIAAAVALGALGGALDLVVADLWRAALPAVAVAGDALQVPASLVAMQVAVAAALVAASFALAASSRSTDDALLGWCAVGAMWLALAHVNTLLAPPSAMGQAWAADLLRLVAVACFLTGAAREIVAHERRVAAAAVAAERRRMARELHDGVAQELAYIVSQATSLARHERPAGPLQSIALAGERALIDSRRSIVTLTSPSESSLREALTEQASQWAARAGLALEVQISDDVQTSSEVQHAILRIVQEAISNTVRHAGATKIMVSLARCDGSVTVRISDDGRGFDASPSRAQPEGCFGLVSMAERAETFGGRLRLESEPGRGTVVEVAFR